MDTSMEQTTDEKVHVCLPKVEAGGSEYLCYCGIISRVFVASGGEIYWCTDDTRSEVEHVIDVLAQPGVTELIEDGS